MASYVLYAMYIHSTPSRSGWPQCSVTTRSARPGEKIAMFESMCHAQAAHWIVVWHLLTCDNSGSSIVTLSSVILFKKWERSQLRGNCCFQINIMDLHFVHVQDVKPGGALRGFSLVRVLLLIPRNSSQAVPVREDTGTLGCKSANWNLTQKCLRKIMVLPCFA